MPKGRILAGTEMAWCTKAVDGIIFPLGFLKRGVNNIHLRHRWTVTTNSNLRLQIKPTEKDKTSSRQRKDRLTESITNPLVRRLSRVEWNERIKTLVMKKRTKHTAKKTNRTMNERKQSKTDAWPKTFFDKKKKGRAWILLISQDDGGGMDTKQQTKRNGCYSSLSILLPCPACQCKFIQVLFTSAFSFDASNSVWLNLPPISLAHVLSGSGFVLWYVGVVPPNNIVTSTLKTLTDPCIVQKQQTVRLPITSKGENILE